MCPNVWSEKNKKHHQHCKRYSHLSQSANFRFPFQPNNDIFPTQTYSPSGPHEPIRQICTSLTSYVPIFTSTANFAGLPAKSEPAARGAFELGAESESFRASRPEASCLSLRASIRLSLYAKSCTLLTPDVDVGGPSEATASVPG